MSTKEHASCAQKQIEKPGAVLCVYRSSRRAWATLEVQANLSNRVRPCFKQQISKINTAVHICSLRQEGKFIYDFKMSKHNHFFEKIEPSLRWETKPSDAELKITGPGCSSLCICGVLPEVSRACIHAHTCTLVNTRNFMREGCLLKGQAEPYT